MELREDDALRATLAAVAPGTELRDGLERILRGRTGALIVLGHDRTVESLSTGGFPLDVEFSATRLRELAKMDGGIVLDREASRILRAATQLVPDPSIETSESGTRHRTAERVAKQTGYPVISVSQSMRIVAIYVDGRRYVLEDSSAILSRANQALQTLERYKSRLDEVTGTLSALEIEDLVTVRDVASVLQRLEMVRRISDEIAGYVVELGVDGRLLTLQLEELTGGLGNDRELVIRDYLPLAKVSLTVDEAMAALEELTSTELLDLAAGAKAVGFTIGGDALDSAVSPVRLSAADQGAAPSRCHRRPPRRALRQPPEAARGQPRGAHGRRRRRRGPRPRRPRGPVPPRRVEHPRTLRVSASPSTSALHERVLEWYAAQARDLPWRRPDASPWGVFVSEIMLQQTPVARVEPVWRDWMERWPDPAALAAEPPGEAVRAWGRLGYPRRALRLHAAAAAMVASYGGLVPDTEETLLTLPGVGTYTAAAVATFAFGERTVVVDTNVRRVLARVVGGEQYPPRSPTRAELAVAAALVPPDPSAARTWSVAVMELGALVCSARAPRCGDCPVAAQCRWRAAGHPPHTGAPRQGAGMGRHRPDGSGGPARDPSGQRRTGRAIRPRRSRGRARPTRAMPRLTRRGRAGRATRPWLVPAARRTQGELR